MIKDTNPKDAIGTKKWRQFSVVPFPVIWEVGVGMLEGALKYGRHNYRAAGVRASVYVDAALGHIHQYWEGEDNDPDSEARLSHITKAICSLVVLRDAMLNDMVTDDRPPKFKGLDALREELQAAVERLHEEHGDKNPKHYTAENWPEEAPQKDFSAFDKAAIEKLLALKQFLPGKLDILGYNDPSKWPKTDVDSEDYNREHVVAGLTQAQIDRLVRHEAQRLGVECTKAPLGVEMWDRLCRRVLLRLSCREPVWQHLVWPDGGFRDRLSSLTPEDWAIASPGCRAMSTDAKAASKLADAVKEARGHDGPPSVRLTFD